MSHTLFHSHIPTVSYLERFRPRQFHTTIVSYPLNVSYPQQYSTTIPHPPPVEIKSGFDVKIYADETMWQCFDKSRLECARVVHGPFFFLVSSDPAGFVNSIWINLSGEVQTRHVKNENVLSGRLGNRDTLRAIRFIYENISREIWPHAK